MVDALSSLGTVYEKTKKFTKALDKYNEAYKIAKINNDKFQMAIIQNNIGEFQRHTKQFKVALHSYNEAYSLFKQLGDKLNATVCSINIGLIYLDDGKPKLSLPYLKEGLKVAKKLNIKDIVKDVYLSYSDAYLKLGNYKLSLKYYKLFTKIKDELFNIANSKNMAEMQTKYETEKKESKILLLSKEQEKEKIIKNSLYVGLILLFALVSLVFNRYRLKTKANNKLEKANYKISEQNNKIMSSIKYAERIQKAILPLDDKINVAFSDNFVLFLPKDIVSGDFYWFSENEHIKYIAVVDCTGHGVPGAFMSMIGNSLLNQIVNEQKEDNPANILEELSTQVKVALKQESGRDTRDGMDMCFCKIEDSNDEIKLTYVGAKRPLFIIKKEENELIEIRGNRKSIGGYQKKKKTAFTNNEIILTKGDFIYLTSDGFVDQHDPDEKKFGSKKFRALLREIVPKSAKQQKEILLKALEEHKKEAEQQDDITIIGVSL
jgi:serine phosphatase RsbU (regulator of sigma subunit)